LQGLTADEKPAAQIKTNEKETKESTLFPPFFISRSTSNKEFFVFFTFCEVSVGVDLLLSCRVD
jgi:hypothetical protein